MKSGRGGPKYDENGNLLTGRKPTGKGERISYQPSPENLAWLREQKAKKRDSYSKTINMALDKERGKMKKDNTVEYIGKGFLGFDPGETNMTIIAEENFDYIVMYKDREMRVRKHEVKS